MNRIRKSDSCLAGLRNSLLALCRDVYHRATMDRNGTISERERHGFLLPRPQYAYGLVRAAEVARYCGLTRVTVCEFEVATGNGLIAMVDLAEQITRATGVEFRVVGFDTGPGLPAVSGCQDPPEIWNHGDSPMQDRDALVARIGDRAELIFGDIGRTTDHFAASLSPDAPLGFCVVDGDSYTASRSALRCLDGPAHHYLPAVPVYFDDTGLFFANRHGGDRLAIEEFNGAHDLRRIDRNRSLRGRKPRMAWHEKSFVAHVMDHPFRTLPRSRGSMTLGEHTRLLESVGLAG